MSKDMKLAMISIACAVICGSGWYQALWPPKYNADAVHDAQQKQHEAEGQAAYYRQLLDERQAANQKQLQELERQMESLKERNNILESNVRRLLDEKFRDAKSR
jgi:uncharacterized protein HemX